MTSGEIASEDEIDSDYMPPLEDASDMEHTIIGQTLVVFRVLHVQAHDGKDEQWRENILYTRSNVRIELWMIEVVSMSQVS